MISLEIVRDLESITCLGAHPDDIEIGAAGTLLHLAATHPAALFRFVVMTGTEERQAEARSSATALLGDRVEVVFGGFAENTLPYAEPAAAKAFIHEVGASAGADLVIAPQPADFHQDHRFVAEVALQAYRDHMIFGYEIPKYDGDMTRPNLYVDLELEVAEQKLDHLSRHFSSQHQKPWYGRDLFSGLLRLRGMESRSDSGFAEAFHAAKLVLR